MESDRNFFEVEGLILNDNQSIASDVFDPIEHQLNLRIGSIYIRSTDGQIWTKTGPTGVNWKKNSGNESYKFPLSGNYVTIINHNLGRAVHAETYTTGGLRFVSECLSISDNQIQITLDSPIDGYVIIQ